MRYGILGLSLLLSVIILLQVHLHPIVFDEDPNFYLILAFMFIVGKIGVWLAYYELREKEDK